MNAIYRSPSGRQCLDLGWFLHNPKPINEITRSHDLRTSRSRLEREGPRGPHVVIDSDSRGGADPVKRVSPRIVGLVPGHYIDTEPSERGRFQRGALECGHDRERIRASRNNQRREALERQGVITRQVAKVRTWRDHHGIEALFVHGGPKARQATVQAGDQPIRGRLAHGPNLGPIRAIQA
jgi:hypothetical protein